MGQAAAEPRPLQAQLARQHIEQGLVRRRAEAAEAALARATKTLEEIDAALLDPKTFADAQKSADLSRRRASAEAALHAAEHAWLEAAEALEAIQTGNG